MASTHAEFRAFSVERLNKLLEKKRGVLAERVALLAERQKVLKLIRDDKDLGENWRDECNGICEKNAYALKKNILTDVTFLVSPESVVIHAHRTILALGSPVFEAMFYGSLAEKGDTITIPDISARGFMHLLRYLYSEDITFTDDGDAFETCVAAHKYCVTNLEIECEKYLNDSLSWSNIWHFLESSLLLNLQTLNDRCVYFLKNDIMNALRDSNFLQVSAKTVENLLRLNSLSVSEAFLIKQVMRWASHKSTLDQTVTFESLMTPLLPFMQFGALTPSHFIRLFDDKSMKGLLSEQDMLSILKYICEPEMCSLPEWCCKENTRYPLEFNHTGNLSGKKIARRKSVTTDSGDGFCLVEVCT